MPAIQTAPTLRPYQRDAVDAILSARRQGVRRQVVCLPTGSGKTVIFSHLARIARRQVIVLAHRSELLEQAREKIARALGDPEAVAIEQADRRAPKTAKVVVCSLRSLHAKRLKQLMAGRQVGLVVYDECHHAVADDNKRVLRALGAFDPDWEGTLLGFTATPARADGIGLDDVFEEIVYSRSLPQMIADGFLAPVRGYRIATAADLTQLRAGADFMVEELAEAIDIEDRNALVARSIQELARDRRTVAFCVTVNHARRLAEALRAVGVSTGIVYGAQKKEKRAEVLSLFRAGKLSAVTNVGVLTEGFDDPEVSCIALARPTKSQGLYAQCVGRGMRLFPGKRDCLILDFVDASSVPLVTLPTLFGLPRDFDFEGRSASESAQAFFDAMHDAQGLELEAGAITLGEIKRRAAAFDPLTLKIDAEIAAISAYAWTSLGSRGLALHVQRKPGWVVEYLVVVRGRGRADRYHVLVAGKKLAHFSRLEDAVEATDYEIDRLGQRVQTAAVPTASWRRGAVPASLLSRLKAHGVAQVPADYGDALALLSFTEHGPARRRR